MSQRMISRVALEVAEVLLVALAVYSLVFLSFAVLPVDPVRTMLGPLASEDAVREMSRQLGFDRPIAERYVVVLLNFFKGDLGTSVFYRLPTADIVLDTLPVTLARFFAGLALGSAVGAGGAILSATAGFGKVRHLFAFMYSVPAFSLMVCVLWGMWFLFGVTPSAHRGLFEIATILSASLYATGAVGLYMFDRLNLGPGRSRQADFLLLLRAPRNSAISVLARSTIPGALSVCANSATTVLTAVTFAEYVFDLPGFSVVFINSASRGDLSIVAFGSMVLAAILLLMQKAVQALSARADVRIGTAPWQ